MKNKGLSLGEGFIGKIPSMRLTKYIRNGSVVTRRSYSIGDKSNTRNQFIQRQRMRHAIALWRELSLVTPMFTNGKGAYRSFLSLASKLPVVYLTKNKASVEGSLLMPGIPVSEGQLPTVNQQLGMVDGSPALITDRDAAARRSNEVFLFYTAEQRFSHADRPTVAFNMRNVTPDEFAVVDGRLALVGNEFADEMKGWALVRVVGTYCSTQCIVTNCDYYERYTTEEALQEAAQSYGGLR